jgi:hypothetical protein
MTVPYKGTTKMRGTPWLFEVFALTCVCLAYYLASN